MSFRLLLAVVVTLAACAGRTAEVSPAEIAELQERVAREPGNGDAVLRLSAALFSANRCDEAITTARTGMVLRPASALGPLVVGQCLERAERFQDALSTYDAFLAAHPDARGSDGVRGRRLLTERARATQSARAALAREAELARTTLDPTVVAVLPLVIVGDSIYRPLSRGLAQMLTSDLALLQRFRMVERLQLSALLDEMQLGQAERFDASTTARVGQLVQAGRMVQGLTQIPDENNVRLEASVVLSTGVVTAPEAVTGRLRDLLQMEKDIVVALAGRLGYQLSQAERTAILENGTQNLAAFLAYSRGLEAEDLGDFSAAAMHFGQASRQDPGFQAARTSHQAAQAAPAAQQASAGQVVQMAQQAPEPPPAADEGGALGSGVTDLAPTQSEQTAAVTSNVTTQASSTSASQPPPPGTPTTTVTGTIRIIFRLP
ncbi:MAG: CsgG/HfaB family protein [Gemmatimonadales bacterium]